MPPKRKLSDSFDENEGQTKKQKLSSTTSNLKQAQIIQKNINNNDTHEQSLWTVDMPPEILFRIFSTPNLTASDLHKAGAVCWSWNSCLKDEAFGWALFATFPLNIIYDGKMLIIQLFDSQEKKIAPQHANFNQYGPDKFYRYTGSLPTELKIIKPPHVVYNTGFTASWGFQVIQVRTSRTRSANNNY